MPPPVLSHADSALDLASLRRRADHWMMGALLIGALVALALGASQPQWTLAWTGSLLLTAAGGALYAFARGHLLARCVFPVLLMAMVALHIQLGQGRIEYHFGVFVTLAFLLLYRDWKPLVIGAGAIAAHHVVFDRLQAAGLSVYCLTEPDIGRVLVHAGYVVVQTGFEIVIGMRMRRDAIEGHELLQLVSRLQQGDRVALLPPAQPQESPAARLLQAALHRIAQAIGAVDQATGPIGNATEEIAAGQRDLSTRTEAAAASLQQTATSMEQLTRAVQANAESAREANRLAHHAADAAARGGEVMSQVVSRMDALSASSRQIAEISGLIDSIAFQTNILALNAAVEAARAGEQGRGFAVVAGEVRHLAQRSAQAAKEIKQLTAGSVEQVDESVQRVHEAGRTMTQIATAIERVHVLLGELSASASSQSEHIGQVHQAIARLDEMTQQNSALVEQSAAASQSLRDQACRLGEVVQVFLLQPGRARGA